MHQTLRKQSSDLRIVPLNAYRSNIILTVYYVYLGKLHISHIARSAALRKVQKEQVQSV